MRSQNANRWRRPGRLELRLAELLAALEERAEAVGEAYFARVQTLLSPEEWARLLKAWSAEEVAPPDIVPKLDADEQTVALWCEMGQLELSLAAAERGAIISEHFWYKELGRIKPPKEWGL